MTDYAAVLLRNYPGTEWALDGDGYSGLTWLDDSPKPTKKALDEAWADVQAALALETAQRNRAAAYAVESDPLFFKWQRGEGTEQEWMDAVQSIRDRYPYP